MRLRRSKPAIRIEAWLDDGTYWFHIVDCQNGKILVASQGYSRKFDRDHTARKVTPRGTPLVAIAPPSSPPTQE